MSDEATNNQPPAMSGKKIRSGKRKEFHREKKGHATDAKEKAEINKKLYFGFRDMSDALLNLQSVTNPRTVFLPISTRGIGFMVRKLINKFAMLGVRNIDFHVLCGALYRVSLYSVGAKIRKSLLHPSRNSPGVHFEHAEILLENIQVLSELGSGFAPLMNLISSIGCYRGFGSTYVPVTAKVNKTGYDPTNVSYLNLRDCVVYLSRQGSEDEVCTNFYEHSPIPNAVWRKSTVHGADGVEQTRVRLANPDEIIPADFGTGGLRRDIDVIKAAIELISRKYPKFTYVGAVDYLALGQATQLVSNKIESIRCDDLDEEHNYMRVSVGGALSEFWSPEAITQQEMYIGCSQMVGEIPIYPIDDEVYHIRSLTISKMEASVDVQAVFGTMLG